MARFLAGLIYALIVGFGLYYAAKAFAAVYPQYAYMIGWLAGGIAGTICALLPRR